MLLSVIFPSIISAMSVLQTPDTLEMAKITDFKHIRSAAPVQRVEVADLEKKGAVTLQEALRTFSGLNIKDYGGLGGMKTVSIRSFGAQHTGVVYDGFTISDAQNGQTDISRFNLEGLQSITVETTGSDDIFRSARLSSYAGTVSMVSASIATDSANVSAHAYMRLASFHTYNPGIGISGSAGKGWGAAFSADFLDSRGGYPFILENGDTRTRETRLNSDIRSLNSELRVHGTLPMDGALDFKATAYVSQRGLPGSVIYYTQSPEERLWDMDAQLMSSYSASPAQDWKVRASAYYTAKWNRFTSQSILYPIPPDDRYMQQEASVSGIAMWNGIPYLGMSIAQDVVVNHLDASLEAFPHPTRISSYTALSAKYTRGAFLATVTLLVTAAGEYTANGSNKTTGHFSPSVHLSYLTPLGIALRASLRESFRMPTFNDMYYPRMGTRKLSPEKAWQTNLGASWEGNFNGQGVHLSADAYYDRVTDKIVAIPSMFVWSMRNLGLVEMAGCDASAGYNASITNWLDIDASLGYSYRYAVDITDPKAKNYRHQIAYTPRHCANASLSFSTPWINLAYTMQGVGERYTLSQNTPAHRIKPYADHCLSLSSEFKPSRAHRWTIHIAAEALNLSGNNYEVIQHYPMPGRNYRITIKIKY